MNRLIKDVTRKEQAARLKMVLPPPPPPSKTRPPTRPDPKPALAAAISKGSISSSEDMFYVPKSKHADTKPSSSSSSLSASSVSGPMPPVAESARSRKRKRSTPEIWVSKSASCVERLGWQRGKLVQRLQTLHRHFCSVLDTITRSVERRADLEQVRIDAQWRVRQAEADVEFYNALDELRDLNSFQTKGYLNELADQISHRTAVARDAVTFAQSREAKAERATQIDLSRSTGRLRNQRKRVKRLQGELAKIDTQIDECVRASKKRGLFDLRSPDEGGVKATSQRVESLSDEGKSSGSSEFWSDEEPEAPPRKRSRELDGDAK